MRKIIIPLLGLILSITLFTLPTAGAQTGSEAVVRAVLFFSPTCPHCHQVINQMLIPMLDEYGERLQVVGIDVSQPAGDRLYGNAIEHFQIPAERRGVPTLVVNDTVLVGSGEIPAEFPGIVETGLANGGIDWPIIPGFSPEKLPTPTAAEAQPEATVAPLTSAPSATLAAVAADSPPSTGTPDEAVMAISEESQPAVETAPAPPPDPVGMTLAAIITGGMGLALVYAVRQMSRGVAQGPNSPPSVLMPLLSGLGLIVAGYLAYVELTHVAAVCGPVGHCNLVQASPYARTLGIPNAILGLLNYLTVIGLWAIQKYGNSRMARLAAVAMVGLTVFGVIFSIYLTVLEIFVIKAVCAWCLSSALITTGLMLLAVMSPASTLHRPTTV